MVGWHHRLNGHEFEQTLGDGEGQGSLACCSPQGRKESDMTERLNNNNKKHGGLCQKTHSQREQLRCMFFYNNKDVCCYTILSSGIARFQVSVLPNYLCTEFHSRDVTFAQDWVVTILPMSLNVCSQHTRRLLNSEVLSFETNLFYMIGGGVGRGRDSRSFSAFG